MHRRARSRSAYRDVRDPGRRESTFGIHRYEGIQRRLECLYTSQGQLSEFIG